MLYVICHCLHIIKGSIKLSSVDSLVFDEADRMLDMGFIDEIKRILRHVPRDRQTLLFSATFSHDVLNLSHQWTQDPVTVEIEPESVATDTVEQIGYLVTDHEKLILIKNVLKQEEFQSVIIFANRRDSTRRLCEKLQKSGVKVGMLSGEVAQHKRTRTLEDFKTGKINVLVATDVAGRGIHIDGVTHVINYQLPDDPDDYVHRIGRTGRAGASGTSICFACEDDSFMIPEVEAETGVKLECVHPDEDLLAELN